MKLKVFIALLVLGLIGGAVVCVVYFPYVFAKNVSGEIIGIERVIQPTAIISGNTPIPSSQVFSFAVAIRQPDGEIFTASSEDRQWAVARKGFCVEAKFLRYPPWKFEKEGTYYGARLVRLYDCPGKGK